MNEPYRLRYTNQIVGVFLLVFSLLLIILSLLLLQAKDVFVDKHHFWVEASQEEVSDLNKGAAVMILGERAGEVVSIRYIEGSDRIRIQLSIDPKMSSEIFEDSVVLLERKYGVGAPVLIIRRQKANGATLVPLAPDNQIVHFQGQADRVEQMAQEVEAVGEYIRIIQETLGPTLKSIDAAAVRFQGSLDNSTDPAFDRTAEAFESFRETNDTLRPDVLQTSEAIRSATKNLETRIETLTQTIEKLADQDLRDTLVEVRESANSVTQTSNDVNEDLAATLATMREAIEQFHKLNEETRDVIRIVRKEANELPGTAANVNDTVSDTQDLVGEIRSHWLLRRYSQQPTSTPQVSPSGVRGGSVR